MSNLLPSDYADWLSQVKERIRSAQYAALKAVNAELIGLYWDLGRMIVERQQSGKRGKSIVELLARDLQAEFPGIQGFSARNIRYMREFWLAYHNNPKLQPLVAEIGWTHNLIIMERCEDDLERESNKPIGVATYRILNSLPTELHNDLPAPEQVAKLLEGIEV